MRLEFGTEHVDVLDQFEVGLFDLEVPEQALDPGLVSPGCRAGGSGWRASAAPLIDELVAELRRFGATVATVSFGCDMAVDLTNDGPVTLMIEV